MPSCLFITFLDKAQVVAPRFPRSPRRLPGIALIAPPLSITLLLLVIEVLLKWNAALLGCAKPISGIYMTMYVVILQKSEEWPLFIDGEPSKMNKVYLAFFQLYLPG